MENRVNGAAPRILIFAGSTRRDSFNRKLARGAAEALESIGANVTYAELRDYPMPLYDGDMEWQQGLPAAAKAFKQIVRAHDGMLIASPEYNGSFPALLKNTIDWISRPEPGENPLAALSGKTAAIISASPGGGGGRRGLRHLRELLEMIGVNVIAEQLSVARAFEAFDADGRLVRPEDREALLRVVQALKSSLCKHCSAAA
jgi:NAD(P)H-dependent FMN reductase